MFERDKDELRELGIPLETGINAAADDEPGYRISRQAYELPEIRLEPDEAAVLGLAARVWRRAELAGRGRGRAAQAASRRDRRGGHHPARHRAAAADGRGRVRAAVGGGARPAAGVVRLPGGRPQHVPAAQPGAVGRGQPARPLVRGRAGHRPGRDPGVPAEPHRRPGELPRAARARSTVPDGVDVTGAGARVGHHAAAAAHGRAAGQARARATGSGAAPATSGPTRSTRDGIWSRCRSRMWAGTASISPRSARTSSLLEPTDLREAVITRLKGALA